MKVITIREPWASLIMSGYKKYEFRTWKTKYRGRLYIHTSIKPEKENVEYYKKIYPNLEINCGKIIGYVDLDDCISITKEIENKLISENKYVYGKSKGRGGYGFKLSNPTKIEPIEVKGKLSIWNY